nr:VRR-NUC domain-containing protein [Secundilactobacillus kimchicus]
MESEHKIQSDIMLALSKSGYTVFRSNAGKVRTDTGTTIMLFPKGFPDLCGFRHSDGRFFCLEIKNEKGRLRDDQKLFAKFVGQFPVLYGLARSVEDALKIVGEDEKD